MYTHGTLWRCRKTQIYFYVLSPFYHQLRFSCFKGRDNLKRTQGRLQIDISAIFNFSMSGLAYKKMWRLKSLVNLTGCSRLAQETCVPQREHPPRVSQFTWEDPLQVLGSWTALKETAGNCHALLPKCRRNVTSCLVLSWLPQMMNFPFSSSSNPFFPALLGFFVVATKRTNTRPECEWSAPL